MEKLFYVYVLVDPRTNTPFYVGKGQRNRYKHHKYNRNKFPHRPVSKRIVDIMESGFQDPLYFICCNTASESYAYDMEVSLITQFGRADCDNGPLLNKTGGGEGWSHNRKWSNEHRTNRELYLKDHPRGRKIDRYDMCGKYLDSHISAQHAIRTLHLTPVVASRIRLCCRRKSNVAGGFRWAYCGTELPPIQKKSRRSVFQHTKGGVLVRRWDSIVEASKSTNTNAGDISNMCKTDRYKSVGGYIWSYAT